ncbi:MAG: 50S ribosomal protein L11 [Bacilli bacterium]|nr:50S ribosomal protein L11 [Bacilli bacterium]
MAKEAVKKIKIQIEAGKATPAPPVGTVLGPAGINLQDFCTKYNEATRDKMGDVLPVEISIYEDRSFDFVVKTPPTAFLLKKYAKVKKGSTNGARTQVATISEATLREIAEIKMPDLNAYNIEEAMNIVEGTARNMGIGIEGHVVEVHTEEKPVYEEEVTEEASTEENSEATETEEVAE